MAIANSRIGGSTVFDAAKHRAERFALHVRKIVEAVSFAALSAAEFKNTSQLLQQRTKDASQVLASERVQNNTPLHTLEMTFREA
jgi:hypothetical protein